MFGGPNDFAIWKRFIYRFFTSAGNQLASVTNGATSVVITWARAEENTDYGIVCTPNWNVYCWVSAKSTTGCTISFSAAAGANAVLSVATFRSED